MKLWYEHIEKIIKSNIYIKWSDLGGLLLGKIVNDNNMVDKILQFPNIVYRTGYKNFELYYSTDEKYITYTLNDIKNKSVKIIILYGTFMYERKINNGSLLEKLLELNN